MRTTDFYRPEWTCGRYDAQHHAALMYNLLEGMAYFFEDISADVMGVVLSIPTNGKKTLSELSERCGLTENDLHPFVQQLAQLNLITQGQVTENGVKEYRHALSEWKRTNKFSKPKRTIEKLPFEMSNAEMAYAEKVGGVTAVMLELTYNCSEKCIHCYNIGATRNDSEDNGRNSVKSMSLGQYHDVIDQLYDSGVTKITLSGGDPFSNPLCWGIIDYIHKKGIAFAVFTNGQSIVNDIERLAGYYPLLVGVSIYSTIPKVHDYITRVDGSWQKSIDVLERLSKMSVPLNVKCCIMRPNVKSYRGVAELAHKLGAYPQFELSISDSVEGDKCARYLRLNHSELEVALRDDNIPLYVGKEAPNFGGQERNMDANGCGAAVTTFCISPNGALMPCCSFHLEFGNLMETSLEEILSNSELLEAWRNATLRQYDECGSHDYCGYCNLCPGLGYSEYGSWKKAAENCCYMAKERFSLATKMQEGYDPLRGKSVDDAIQSLPDYERKALHRVFEI